MKDLYNPYRAPEPRDVLSGMGSSVELFGTILAPTVRPVGPPLPAGFHTADQPDCPGSSARHPVRQVVVGLLVCGLALAFWIGQGAESVQASPTTAPATSGK